MFKLEPAISEWRETIRMAGIDSAERLDELESHLREEIEAQVGTGNSEESAFITAVKQIGRPEILKPEYAKAGETVYEQMKRLYYALAGIQNHQLATTMNNSIKNLDPRLATYAKSAVFVLPAVIVWAGFCVLVLPKLNQVRLASGMEIGKPLTTVLAATEFIRANFVVLSMVMLVVLAVLEWRAGWWARYRRPIFGVAAYSLNILVLVSLAMLAILAVAAGAHLASGK